MSNIIYTLQNPRLIRRNTWITVRNTSSSDPRALRQITVTPGDFIAEIFGCSAILMYDQKHGISKGKQPYWITRQGIMSPATGNIFGPTVSMKFEVKAEIFGEDEEVTNEI